jgi:hypothetical protein
VLSVCIGDSADSVDNVAGVVMGNVTPPRAQARSRTRTRDFTAADAVNKARVINATSTANATAAAKAAADAADVGRSSGCSIEFNSEGVSSTYDSLQDSGSSASDSSASLIGSFELLPNASYRLSDTQGRLRIGDFLVTATGAVDVGGKLTAASAIASTANATKMASVTSTVTVTATETAASQDLESKSPHTMPPMTTTTATLSAPATKGETKCRRCRGKGKHGNSPLGRGDFAKVRGSIDVGVSGGDVSGGGVSGGVSGGGVSGGGVSGGSVGSGVGGGVGVGGALCAADLVTLGVIGRGQNGGVSEALHVGSIALVAVADLCFLAL